MDNDEQLFCRLIIGVTVCTLIAVLLSTYQGINVSKPTNDISWASVDNFFWLEKPEKLVLIL